MKLVDIKGERPGTKKERDYINSIENQAQNRLSKNLAKGDIDAARGVKTESERTLFYYTSFDPPEEFGQHPEPSNFSEKVELFSKKYIEGPLGGDLDQGSIYLQGDQGKGDVIQFNISGAESAGNKVSRIGLPGRGSETVIINYFGVNKHGKEVLIMVRKMSASQYDNFIKELREKGEEERKKMEEEDN